MAAEGDVISRGLAASLCKINKECQGNTMPLCREIPKNSCEMTIAIRWEGEVNN